MILASLLGRLAVEPVYQSASAEEQTTPKAQQLKTTIACVDSCRCGSPGLGTLLRAWLRLFHLCWFLGPSWGAAAAWGSSFHGEGRGARGQAETHDGILLTSHGPKQVNHLTQSQGTRMYTPPMAGGVATSSCEGHEYREGDSFNLPKSSSVQHSARHIVVVTSATVIVIITAQHRQVKWESLSLKEARKLGSVLSKIRFNWNMIMLINFVHFFDSGNWHSAWDVVGVL